MLQEYPIKSLLLLPFFPYRLLESGGKSSYDSTKSTFVNLGS